MSREAALSSDVTLLLHDLAAGDASAADRLMPLVYDELRRIAASYMRRERADHTLQATALVNEAYVRLADSADIAWTGKAHFFGIAARLMRQILVDHARAHTAAKRGGNAQHVTLQEGLLADTTDHLELIDLDRALTELAAQDARTARVAELRIFGGMTVRETAHALGVSNRTVDDDWAMARMWLSRAMRPDP